LVNLLILIVESGISSFRVGAENCIRDAARF